MNRNTWAATVATIAVVAVITLGLRVLGGPGTQRLVQSDLRTLRTLGGLAQQIKFTWDSSWQGTPRQSGKVSQLGEAESCYQ